MDKRDLVGKLPPLASSEDLSEDICLDSPDADNKITCLEDIQELPITPTKSPKQQTICLAMPNTPRIDISRASSSSHHDDSSPERELFVGKSSPLIIKCVSANILNYQLHRMRITQTRQINLNNKLGKLYTD